MKSLKLLPHRTAILFMAAASFGHGHADDLYQSYCSNENTGSDYSAVYNIYQSNGACETTCVENYAYAVVQDFNCWCSNYAPANQVSVSECSQACPGYPYEDCGNESSGLYGYVALSISPSGTAGSSSAAASSTQASSTEASSSAAESTTTQVSSYSSSSPSTTETSSTPTSTYVPVVASTAASSVSTSQVTVTPTPVTSTRVVTLSGAIVTQTVTSTPVPVVSPEGITEEAHHKSVSGGTIAGAVIGGIVGLALLVLAAFFLLRRRNRKGDPESPKAMQRNASVLSRAGLLSSARAVDAEKSDDPPYGGAAGVNTQRNSTLYGDGIENDSPISAVGAGLYDISTHDSRRNSRPLVYDQRLNPAALMSNWDLNGSRTSVNTMQDQRDYSRPLGITNPDLHD